MDFIKRRAASKAHRLCLPKFLEESKVDVLCFYLPLGLSRFPINGNAQISIIGISVFLIIHFFF